MHNFVFGFRFGCVFHILDAAFLMNSNFIVLHYPSSSTALSHIDNLWDETGRPLCQRQTQDQTTQELACHNTATFSVQTLPEQSCALMVITTYINAGVYTEKEQLWYDVDKRVCYHYVVPLVRSCYQEKIKTEELAWMGTSCSIISYSTHHPMD